MTKIGKQNRNVRVNERIRVPKVRLVDENGKMIGVISTRQALDIARERGYDLVEVSPSADPPVCRIMDYGKYKYEQNKKAKRAKKKQHTMHVKEIKMRPKIEPHDYSFKINHARKFLEHNDKVKFHLIFRGREVTHPDIGLRILGKVAEDLGDIATVEAGPKKEGMVMTMVLCPKPASNRQREKAMEVADATSEKSGAVEEKT